MSSLVIKEKRMRAPSIRSGGSRGPLIDSEKCLLAIIIIAVIAAILYILFLKELIQRGMTWLYVTLGAFVEAIGYYYDPSMEMRLIRFAIYALVFGLVFKAVTCVTDDL